MDNSSLYTASEVARRIGRSPNWVRMLASQGRLRVACTTAEGKLLFAPVDVDLLADEYAERDRQRDQREQRRHGEIVNVIREATARGKVAR